MGAKQDGNRLLKQIEKQILFSARCRKSNLHAVSTPEIYGIAVPKASTSESSFIVDMEYIPFHDVRHIMLEKDRATNEWLIDTAIDLVDSNLSLSAPVELGEHLSEFEKKAASIKSAMQKSLLVSGGECETFERQINRVLQSFRALRHKTILVGPCHGDLTLANMLVDPENRELCVFDFLDSFVVSPSSNNDKT